ncbi:MAG: DUF3604 domain-containing protein [Kiritimatiellia bacterium]
MNPHYGDLHNHCGLSYGHGTVEDALRNAREQLDFCSVTGHALWPDMPAETPDIKPILDFTRRGFARVRDQWDDAQETLEKFQEDGRFSTFPGFEMHSCEDGDYTVLYRDPGGKILEVSGLTELQDTIRRLRGEDIGILAFPHHLAYKKGQRGVNWDSFDPGISPLIEVVSMHGCSELLDSPRPFLHSMGPADAGSSLAAGLELGVPFGVIGGTDHHSAHPGSYGHGRMGVWAANNTREDLWDGFMNRRTWALTGDRIELNMTMNGQCMGSTVGPADTRNMTIDVEGGAAIDVVDVVRNGRIAKRFTIPEDLPEHVDPCCDPIRTKIFIEVGWGTVGKPVDWQVDIGISDGEIRDIEPRFRGAEVVSPLDAPDGAEVSYYVSQCRQTDTRAVSFRTRTCGNPNTSTCATQGVCLYVDMPRTADVLATVNSQKIRMPLEHLLAGQRCGRLGLIDSPCWLLHRVPLEAEYKWNLTWQDSRHSDCDTYYVRVRQRNGQWAWSSPVVVT